MSAAEEYDLVVLGSGAAGKPVPAAVPLVTTPAIISRRS